MTRIIIIGAGGHGQVVADILLSSNPSASLGYLVGFLDDDEQLLGTTVLGVPVLGNVAQLPECGHDGVIVAIGDNLIRKQILAGLMERGERIVSAIHASAIIGLDVHIGIGVTVCAGVVVNTGSVIGDGVILNTSCTIDHHSRIGDCAHIAPGAHLGGSVQVLEGSLIGIGSAIIPGCSIGEWAVVGAGAVVTTDIPYQATVVGPPLRVVPRNPHGGKNR